MVDLVVGRPSNLGGELWGDGLIAVLRAVGRLREETRMFYVKLPEEKETYVLK